MKKHIRTVLSGYTFKIFILFFTATALLTSLVSYAIFHKSNELLKDEILQSNQRLLKQIKSNTESYLVDKLNLVIDTYFYDGIQQSSFNVFVKDKKQEPYFHYQVFKEISQIIYINDFITDFAVYSKSSDICIAYSTGVSYDYISSEKYQKNILHEQIMASMDDEREQFWISPSENALAKEPTITFVMKLPSIRKKGASWEGIVAIHLDQEKLFHSLAEIYDEQGYLFVTDKTGHLFAHSESQQLYEELDAQIMNELFPIEEDTLQMITLDGNTYAMASLLSHQTGLAYVSLIPFASFYKENIQLLNFTLIMLLTIFPLVIFLFLLLAKILYRPFKKIIMLVHHDAGPACRSDPQLLENMILKLSAKASQMDQFVKDNTEILTIRLFHNLISGNLNSSEELQKRLRFLKVGLKGDSFHLISIEIDPAMLEALTAEEDEFMKHKTLQYCLDFFAGAGIGISDADHRILVLLNPSGQHDTDFQKLQQHISHELGLRVNFSTSNIFYEIKEFPSIIKAVTTAHKYHFLYGYGNIFYQDEVTNWEHKNLTLSIPQLEQIRKWILGNDIGSAIDWISDFFSTNRLKEMSYQSAQANAMQIINIIAGLLHNEWKQTTINKEDLLKKFYDIQNINECISWMNELFCIYSESRKELLENTSIVSQIQEYIQSHIEEDISLTAISAKFYVSESHLSRLFKEKLQTNFSDYVIDLKLEHAARLLVENMYLPISEIMTRLGYTTQSYFSKIFKAKYGVTPSQYRKQASSGQLY